MTDQELNRAVQYVVASTSYGRETVEEIMRTGFGELTHLATTSSKTFDRAVLVEYILQWTLAKTGHPEPLVREILDCAGRWLDEVYATLQQQDPEVHSDSNS